ncbi:LLM class flavin-dependent oxidoreductase [Mechercharimyces sp. CAU 1602]|uniref:LLM class flavin-dependent oxidoreductase n=1 Tax=Mechercharimyces sp. CAU 1602 TaxID=2973933 RepID=UPI002162D549|nr:LLM class flavin-dependent oxidoreductase [Mechercharimyces sp. CAU 1602]MCS1350945.1 LLM class flavin-dependent oxidoreductase [Mechercharimyces sp. CAU 1602]
MMKLSILDQSPIPSGKNASEALMDTRRLAQAADQLGYHRFWVSEHHYSPSLAGSSPEVLISHLAAATDRLRIGSGGVMLPHYSSYKVAENFKVLEGLYPNRIDLGVGRAPGGMPLATKALQEGKRHQRDHYAEQLSDLMTYLHDQADEQHRFPRLLATPLLETAPQMWLLGSSGGSARLAAERGIGYAFAQFINGAGGAEVVHNYVRNFRPTVINQTPHTLLAIFVICAETDAEAERLASSLDLSLLMLEKGMIGGRGIPSIEEAEKYPFTAMDRMIVERNRSRMVVGSKTRVAERLLQLSEEYSTDELMLVTITHDIEAKIYSYQLVAEAIA